MYSLRTIRGTASLSYQIKFKNFVGPLKLTVVGGTLPSLLGLDWLVSLGMVLTGIYTVQDDSADELIKEFADVFNGSLGKYAPISFGLDPNPDETTKGPLCSLAQN